MSDKIDRTRKQEVNGFMELHMWREMLAPYYFAVEELLVKFRNLQKEFRDSNQYCPIEEVQGRVKSISSILGKVQKKQYELGEVEDKIEDIAGIRIICQFKEDIDKVVNLIRNRSDMIVKSEKDYIRNPKSSGYQSYHMILYYDINMVNETKRIQVEIQIRTMGMNFWATIEHSLQYKYKRNIPEHIKKRLKNSAQAVVNLDEEMSTVRDEIMDAQNAFTIKDRLVSDILKNIQGLFHVTNTKEVMKIQDEFYRVYQSGNMDQLKHFSKQLDIITEGYRAQNLG